MLDFVSLSYWTKFHGIKLSQRYQKVGLDTSSAKDFEFLYILRNFIIFDNTTWFDNQFVIRKNQVTKDVELYILQVMFTFYVRNYCYTDLTMFNF